MKKRYHFIGIGGIGMSALASLLLEQGYEVSGSDLSDSMILKRLQAKGAVVYRVHAAENIPSDAIVVYSTDIHANNIEILTAKEKGYSLIHRSDLLAQFVHKQSPLAVAGSHGKTTTSSLLASVLIEANLEPSFAIGGVLSAYQTNSQAGAGKYFVFEADESDRSFMKYFPFGAIITNIDHEHLNHYDESFDLLVDTFKKFMAQVKETNYLFWCRDNPHLAEINFSGQTYGLHPESDWRIRSIRQEGFRMIFDLEHQGKCYKEIDLALVGDHNAYNAAAVFGLSLSLGIPEEGIRRTFSNFKGVLRRCEKKNHFREVLFIDDYAHHPTEIQATLNAIKHAIGSKRLIAVFQPHRYTRIQACLELYGTVFDRADELLITDIYAAGEKPIPNLSSHIIKEEIEKKSSISCHFVSRSELSQFLSRMIQPHDVIVTLGAGDITHLTSETVALLSL